MSMAEAVAVVAETGQAIPVVPTVSARPRISADSFRNLTARLMSANAGMQAAAIAVPTISVTLEPPPQQITPPAEMHEPDPVPGPADADGFAEAANIAHAEYDPEPELPTAAAPAEQAFAPGPDSKPHAELTSWFDAPHAENFDIIPAEIIKDEIVNDEIFRDEIFRDETFQDEVSSSEIAPVGFEQAEAAPPALDEADIITENVQPAPRGLEPVFVDIEKPEPSPRPAASLIERAIGTSQPTPPPQRTLPELVNPLEVMAAQEAERRAEEERLQAEAEARAALAPPRDPEEEARKLAELAEARAIENIWRQLLATPTKEDCAAYLRDAREEMGDDAFAPIEEHDLSLIQPADQLEAEQPLPDITDEVAADEQPAAPVAEPATVIPATLDDGNQDTAEFARSLLDMMAAGASSGLPHERALAADTLLRLLPRLDLKPLVMLSQRLAMMESPPHLLVAKLIRDPRVEVSGPLLEDCMHITDNDLCMVIDENQPDKLRMIARRRKLSRAISDALITKADSSVLLTLVRNMEAEISHEGFNTLIEATDANPDILAPLSTRPDLGAPFAFELFWHAPAQLRRYLLTRFLTDSETLTKILKITMATKEEDETSEIEPMSQHAILEALGRAARGKLEPACDELSAALQIDAKTAMRILSDQEGEPLVILLKAANYSRSAVPGLLRRMTEADFPIISSERDPEDLQSLFDTLSFNKARILLTYWDWATTKTGPYAPVH